MSDNNYRKTSYSQVAEDLIAAYLLGRTDNVKYVDIGCLWPIKFSNTYLFYLSGGFGVCIDPNPAVAAEFKAMRPRDIHVTAGVGDENRVLTYYEFGIPVFNTFDQARAQKLNASNRPGRKIEGTREIAVKPLIEILKEHSFLEQHGNIDLLSIDVEGLESSILSAIDFNIIRPEIIIVETAVIGIAGRDTISTQILSNAGYNMIAWIGHDAFFRRVR